MGDIFDQIAEEVTSGRAVTPRAPDIFDQIAEEVTSSAAKSPADPYGTTLGVLKGVAKAGTDVITAPADLLFRGGMGALDYIRGKDTNLQGAYPSDYRDKFLNWISQDRGDESAENVSRLVGNLATVVAAPSQAKNIASSIPVVSKAAETSKIANLLAKTIGYGTEGAAYGALFNAKDENLGEKATEGAAWNIAVPAALKVTGDLAKGLKNALSEGGRKLELSAFGAGKQAIKDAVKRMPDILDDSGNFNNPISESINSFHAAGGGKNGMSGAALIQDLEKQTSPLVTKLVGELEGAQKLQTDPIIPAFKFTDEYINGLAGTNKGEAQKIAAEEIAKTVNNTDGTLLSLQSEKVKLGDAIKDTAWGQDAPSQLRVNILKRIRADLRSAIEEGYGTLTGKSPTTISKLNNEIGKRENLFPLFKDMLLSGEARTVLSSGLQSLRTSGGVGQTFIAGAAGLGVGGLPVGMGAVGLNMFLQSPVGKRALANGLRSGVVQAPLAAVSKASDLAPALGRLSTASTQQSDQASDQYSSGGLRVDQLRDLIPQSEGRGKQAKLGQSNLNRSSFNPTSATTANQSDYGFMNTLFKGDKVDKQAVEIIEQIKQDPVDHAIMLMESGGDPNAKNPESSASGLFQLIKKTAGALGVKDVFDPAQNYEGYKKLKAAAIKNFGSDDPATIYAAHYLGEPTMRKWLSGEALTDEQEKQVAYLQTVLLPRLQKIYAELTGKDVVEA